MTAFTVNAGGTVNWDTLTGGSTVAALDSYAISNNTTLRIDTDSFQCANHSAAFGSLDTVTFSGTGGGIHIDGRSVRLIPFNSGSGVTPAIGTTISQGGVSAYFLGVWSTLLVEPLAVGAAMPATGYIKVRNKTGGNFAAGALTGITASATGPDVVGWIEVRGADTGAINTPRVATITVTGEWFELGSATGVANQVLPCPCSSIVGVIPGVQVETSAGSGVYEWWRALGTMAASTAYPNDSFRGKFCWQTTAGIRFGSDGTNTVGAVPAAGCKIRIPNVFLTCCTRTTSGSGVRVLPNSTLATRQEFVTSSAGALSFDKACIHWYTTFSQPYSVSITNCAVSDTIIVSECATAPVITDSCVSHTQVQINTALQLTSCFAGTEVRRNIFNRVSLAASGTYVSSMSYCREAIFDSNLFSTSTNKANATCGVATISYSEFTWNNAKHIGARMLLSSCTRADFTGTFTYSETFTGTVSTSYSHFLVDTSTSSNITINVQPSFPVANNAPYGGLFQFGGSKNCSVTGIGSFAAPLALPTTSNPGYIVSSGGNNSGIKVSRIYVTNTRSGVHSFLNSDGNVRVENVWSDYADTTAMAMLNGISKGCGWAASTAGQVSVYGTHIGDYFTSATVGKVIFSANEPTSVSANQFKVVSGSPKFNSGGGVLLTTLGDTVEFEMPYFAKGHTAFANTAPTISTATNLSATYQVDVGSGYGGTWKSLTAANLSAETGVDPSVGFRLKVRVTATATSASNVLTYISVATVTTSAAQSINLYPLSVATLNLTGLKSGSDVVIRTPGTTTVLSSSDSIPSTTYAYEYDAGEVSSVDVFVHKAGYVPWSIRGLSVTSAGASIPVQQVVDRAYI